MEYRITPGRLEIGKFSLYYERVGAGAPIVFLHGLGGNHLSWWQQVPYFMRSFECITVDQRGFGLSSDPDDLFNRAHASDLGALLDHLKIDKAVLVGQSMGGWTIVGYALEHPERVAAMVMADTPGGIFTPEMKFEAPRDAATCRCVAADRIVADVCVRLFRAASRDGFSVRRDSDSRRAPARRRQHPAARPALRSRGGEESPDDADTVHGRRGGHSDPARDRQGARRRAAQFAAAHGARQRPFDLFRERRRRSTSWSAISCWRSATRSNSERQAPAAARFAEQGALDHREQIALFAVDQIVQTYRERRQRRARFGDLFVRSRDERCRIDGSRQLAQAGVLFASAQDQIGREILLRLHPRQHDILFAAEVTAQSPS